MGAADQWATARTTWQNVEGTGDRSRSSVSPLPISGFRLNNARASYGFGLTTFAIGFPDPHRLDVADALQSRSGKTSVFATEAQFNGFLRGSDYFRKLRFSVWIGYDF